LGNYSKNTLFQKLEFKIYSQNYFFRILLGWGEESLLAIGGLLSRVVLNFGSAGFLLTSEVTGFGRMKVGTAGFFNKGVVPVFTGMGALFTETLPASVLLTGGLV
jgi:hypothetical protein